MFVGVDEPTSLAVSQKIFRVGTDQGCRLVITFPEVKEGGAASVPSTHDNVCEYLYKNFSASIKSSCVSVVFWTAVRQS